VCGNQPVIIMSDKDSTTDKNVQHSDSTEQVVPSGPLAQLLTEYRSRATKLDDQGEVRASEEVRECADNLETALGNHHKPRTTDTATDRTEDA